MNEAAHAVNGVQTADRLLYGAPAIAAYLGIRVRQARHQIDQGRIPHFQMGKIICARPSTLDAWLESLEAAGD